LALVLVESVTGRVPFASDTPLGTLAARTQAPIVAPEELGALGRVVERAGRPDPSERYPDARAMGEAIAGAAGRLPRPGPLTLAGLGRTVEDPHPTELRRTGGLFDQDADETVETPVPNGDDAPPMEPALVADRAPGSQRAVPIVVGAIVALVLAIATALVLARPGAATTAAPSLVGLTQKDAADRASQAGVRMEVEERTSDDPAGFVIEQSPGPGEWLRDGGTVTVVVSRGPPPVPVPDVTGQPEAAAQLTLTAEGFLVELVPEHSEDAPAGTALRTDPPAGAKHPPDSTIKLVVSAGPAPVPVPDVTGRTYDEAVTVLADARLNATLAEEFSDEVEAGKVIRTEPAVGAPAARDSAVTVVVSKGPELVDVPDLGGMSVEAASAALRAVGLAPDVEDYEPGGTVRAQDPDAGTQLKKGETVTLFL
ncbi:MAG TPA: PASTA domain-containing protein, partial [Acidimicrobiia bacterium]|nr:PASTA domain-containing protein [Acidimicrobiia bacterium]